MGGSPRLRRPPSPLAAPCFLSFDCAQDNYPIPKTGNELAGKEVAFARAVRYLSAAGGWTQRSGGVERAIATENTENTENAEKGKSPLCDLGGSYSCIVRQ